MHNKIFNTLRQADIDLQKAGQTMRQSEIIASQAAEVAERQAAERQAEEMARQAEEDINTAKQAEKMAKAAILKLEEEFVRRAPERQEEMAEGAILKLKEEFARRVAERQAEEMAKAKKQKRKAALDKYLAEREPEMREIESSKPQVESNITKEANAVFYNAEIQYLGQPNTPAFKSVYENLQKIREDNRPVAPSSPNESYINATYHIGRLAYKKAEHAASDQEALCEQAIGCLNDATICMPEKAELYEQLGKVYKQLKMYPEAIKSFERAQSKTNFRNVQNRLFKEVKKCQELMQEAERQAKRLIEDGRRRLSGLSSSSSSSSSSYVDYGSADVPPPDIILSTSGKELRNQEDQAAKPVPISDIFSFLKGNGYQAATAGVIPPQVPTSSHTSTSLNNEKTIEGGENQIEDRVSPTPNRKRKNEEEHAGVGKKAKAMG